jgi:aminopeptidase N
MTLRNALHAERFKQSCAATPNQAVKEPFVIPVLIGPWETVAAGTARRCSELDQASRTFVMTATETVTFDRRAVTRGARSLHPAWLQAPVVLDFDYTDAQLLTLLANDPDPLTAGKPGSAWHFEALSNS